VRQLAGIPQPVSGRWLVGSGSKTGVSLHGRMCRAAVVLVVAGSWLAVLGCTRDEPSARGVSPGESSVAGGSGSVAGSSGVGTGSPPGTLAPAELAAKAPGSPDLQRCVQARLLADPALASALGSDPSASPRSDDWARLVSGCAQSSMADRFAASVSLGVPGGLSGEQLRCVRDGFAGLSPEAMGSVVQAGLNPDAVSVPAASGPLGALLSGCGVDPSVVKVGL